MSNPVSWRQDGGIAVISVDNPPVNALSHAVRSGLLHAINDILKGGASKANFKAVVLHCGGRTWFAGADIREFGKPPADPWLPAVLDRMESSPIPVVSAIHGTALGGGLETALASHYRMASPDAKFGFPEIALGLLPGAGGTQRAPRLMGVEAAMDLIQSGKPIGAKQALASGLIDRVAEGDLLAAALAWATELAEKGEPPRRVSALPVPTGNLAADYFASYRASMGRKARGLPAPQAIVDCVEAATKLDFESGSKFEREKFAVLLKSPESAGLRHVFFAERQASKVDGLPTDTPLRPVKSVGIIGAGTMGGGIAMGFANAGIPVTVLEINREALDRGLGVCRANYERSAASGRFTAEQAQQYMGRIRGTTDYQDLAQADLVIEAVFENPDIKKEVFRKLDAVCKPGAILATNTSYQDVDAIAAVTKRPGDVLGMHFFSPANVMKLLEVVRARETADDVLATVLQLAKTIRKVPVVARVCYGFIGNRMLEGYFREAQMMLLEGATPAQIDKALEDFGMAMGPLAVGDLAGLDVGFKARQSRGKVDSHPAVLVANALVEKGQFGQKAGAGYYLYDPATRQRQPNPEVENLVNSIAAKLGIKRRTFTDAEIVERVIYPLINEGARILEEGIAQRPGDIDIVYLYGYGFPAHRGGPMFYADTVGVKRVYDRICALRDSLGRPQDWQPAPLLEEYARSEGCFG